MRQRRGSKAAAVTHLLLLFAQALSCPSVGFRSCVVSFAGERGVRHSVEVTADTLYEAAATALSIFKQSRTMHRVTPHQIQRWCDGVAVSPDELSG